MKSTGSNTAWKPKIDSRESPRVEAHGVTVSYEHEAGESVIANVFDLSAGGLFIEAAKPLKIGKTVDLEINVFGDSETIAARGRVFWSRESAAGDSRPPGMALHFQDLEPDALEAIVRLVHARAASAIVEGAPVRDRLPTMLGVAPAPPVAARSTRPSLAPEPSPEGAIAGDDASDAEIDALLSLASAPPSSASPSPPSEAIAAQEPPASETRPRVMPTPATPIAHAALYVPTPQPTLDAISYGHDLEPVPSAKKARLGLPALMLGLAVAIGLIGIGARTLMHTPASASAAPKAAPVVAAPPPVTEVAAGQASPTVDLPATAAPATTAGGQAPAAKVEPPAPTPAAPNATMKATKGNAGAGAPSRKPQAPRAPKRPTPKAHASH
jgi:Tfp pilus assembly protein PilZ